MEHGLRLNGITLFLATLCGTLLLAGCSDDRQAESFDPAQLVEVIGPQGRVKGGVSTSVEVFFPEVVVHYRQGLELNSFRAKLNGKDVTELFHPRPQWVEKVALPLNVGDNDLLFEVAPQGADAQMQATQEYLVKITRTPNDPSQTPRPLMGMETFTPPPHPPSR